MVNVHEVLGVEVVVSILLDDRYIEAIDGEMHIFTLKSTATPGIAVLKLVEAEDGLWDITDGEGDADALSHFFGQVEVDGS